MGRKPQVVVITGASAGVGRATADAFARRGASLALIARDAQRLHAARAEIEVAGARVMTLPLDVADSDAVEHAAALVEDNLGPIDVWINNAMVSVFSPVIEMTAEEYRRVTEVTYLGYVYGTLAALKRMQPRDRGVIVQVGSALSHRSIPLQSAYCAAKHAVNGFTESLRCELLHEGSGVRVTVVQLPALNTPQFGWTRSRLTRMPQPVPPIYQPEVAARAIVWASRHAPRELLAGGPTIKAVVGGSKLAPGFADRYLARRGYAIQQTAEPDLGGHPDNLWTPVPGNPGARGRFDAVAFGHSLELEAFTRVSSVASGVTTAARWLSRALSSKRQTPEPTARPGGTPTHISRTHPGRPHRPRARARSR